MENIFFIICQVLLIAAVVVLAIRVNLLESKTKELSDIAAHTAIILDELIALQKYNDPACGYTQFFKGVDGKLIPVSAPTKDRVSENKTTTETTNG